MDAFPALDQSYAPFILTALRQPLMQQEQVKELPVYGCWFLVLVEEGHGSYTTASDRIDLPPGSLLLGHPGRPGSLRAPRGAWVRRINFDVVQRRRRRRMEFGWEPLETASVQPEPQTLLGSDLPWLIPPGLLVGMSRMLIEITDRWWHNAWEQFRANQLLAGWLLRLIEHALEDTGPVVDDAPEPILAAERFARDSHELRCRVPDLARVAGLGPTAFAALYRQVRGETVGAYLRHLRLEHAARMLREHDEPVATIARICGFRSAPTFARAFRSQFGMNPATWRRAQRRSDLP